jgi:hypothetical protein
MEHFAFKIVDCLVQKRIARYLLIGSRWSSNFSHVCICYRIIRLLVSFCKLKMAPIADFNAGIESLNTRVCFILSLVRSRVSRI